MIQAGIVQPVLVGRDNVGLADAQARPCPQDGPVVLIIGQSNVGNLVDVVGTFSDNVTNFYDGQCYAAQDPLLGASGRGGSLWSRMEWTGTPLLVPIAFGSTKVSEWRPGGPLWPRVTGALAQLELQGREPTHIVYHQGEHDAMEATDATDYEQDLTALLNALGERTTARIIVGQTSFCRDVESAEILAAQERAVLNAGAVLGPNTDTLGKDMRYDRCHFNEEGARRAAGLWQPFLDWSDLSRRPVAMLVLVP